MKLLATLALITSLLFQPPCAEVSITLTHPTLSLGATQTIDTQLTNCGDKKTKYQLTVTVTDAIGNITLLRNDSLILNPGQSLTVQNLYAVGGSAPTGTYRVMSIAFHTAQGSTTEIARDEETFTVVP